MALAPVTGFTPGKVIFPHARYPEGPQLTPQGLLVAEMPANRISLVAPGKAPRVVWSRPGCGPTSVKAIPSGGYWVLCHLDHRLVRLDAKFKTVTTITNDTGGKRIVWPNDGSVDSKGNLYFSSSGIFDLSAPPEGRVMYADASTNVVTELVGGIRYANGVRTDEAHGRLLVSEMLKGQIWSYPMLAPGKLGKPTPFFNFRDAPTPSPRYPLSGPDGIMVMPGGEVLVADYGNARLMLTTDAGKLITVLPVKFPYVTNMALSPDQSEVYITMTQTNETEEEPGMVQAFKIDHR
jgi:gluconolactonase